MGCVIRLAVSDCGRVSHLGSTGDHKPPAAEARGDATWLALHWMQPHEMLPHEMPHEMEHAEVSCDVR